MTCESLSVFDKGSVNRAELCPASRPEPSQAGVAIAASSRSPILVHGVNQDRNRVRLQRKTFSITGNTYQTLISYDCSSKELFATGDPSPRLPWVF